MEECIMRKNMIICAVIAPVLLSCTDRFERLNTNPNQVTSGQMEAKNYRTGTKVLALQSLVVPVEEHQYQFIESLSGGPFGGYVGSTVDTWQTRFETFNPSTDWRKATFSDIITELYAPYRGIVGGTVDEIARAFASLFRVAVMQRLTDNYGPIPYGDILKTEKKPSNMIRRKLSITKCSRNLTMRLRHFHPMSDFLLPDGAHTTGYIPGISLNGSSMQTR